MLFEHSLHSHHSLRSQYVEMEPRKEMAMDPQPMLALRPVQMEMRVVLWQHQTERQNWAQIFVRPDL